MRKNNLKKLYAILRELECELQTLGVRSDFGVPTEPSFAVETLASAILFMSEQPDAESNLLRQAAQDLLEVEIRRTGPHENTTHSLGAWDAANKSNTAHFNTLLEAYRRAFKMPETAEGCEERA